MGQESAANMDTSIARYLWGFHQLVIETSADLLQQLLGVLKRDSCDAFSFAVPQLGAIAKSAPPLQNKHAHKSSIRTGVSRSASRTKHVSVQCSSHNNADNYPATNIFAQRYDIKIGPSVKIMKRDVGTSTDTQRVCREHRKAISKLENVLSTNKTHDTVSALLGNVFKDVLQFFSMKKIQIVPKYGYGPARRNYTLYRPMNVKFSKNNNKEIIY